MNLETLCVVANYDLKLEKDALGPLSEAKIRWRTIKYPIIPSSAKFKTKFRSMASTSGSGTQARI